MEKDFIAAADHFGTLCAIVLAHCLLKWRRICVWDFFMAGFLHVFINPPPDFQVFGQGENQVGFLCHASRNSPAVVFLRRIACSSRFEKAGCHRWGDHVLYDRYA